MKSTSMIRASILGSIVILICTTALAQDVLIITNKSVTVSHISNGELRDIFTGIRSRFGDGSRAIPVVLKGGPVHEVFLHHHVGDNPDEFRARWRRAVFTGQGSMLKEFSSEAALLNYVSATPGAIGYVSRAEESDGVKVLTVSQ